MRAKTSILGVVLLSAVIVAGGVTFFGERARGEGPAYDGVTPGTPNKPPGPEVGGKGRIVTFPGFQQLPGRRSRVFVQTSTRVEPVVTQTGGRFEIVLPGTSVQLSNNRRPLETAHFDTPLLRASVQRRKGDAVLVLQLKYAIDSVQVHVQPGEDGHFFVFVELPAAR